MRDDQKISRTIQDATRARSRWGAIANPTLKFLTPPPPPAPPSPTPGNENSVQYVFDLLFVRTYKVWCKNL